MTFFGIIVAKKQMETEKLEKLKNSLFSEKELENILKSVVNELLNSKVKNETISPLILTHKEFVDVSLIFIVKKLKDKLFEIISKKGVFSSDFDKLVIFILKEDMQGKKIIHKTIAKYILNLIKKDHLKLNYFASTMLKRVYIEKNGKYEYPIFYPFDSSKYSSPIPEIKQLMVKCEIAKKYVFKQETKIKELSNKIDKMLKKVEESNIIKKDILEISKKLEEKYKLFMLKQEYKYLDLIKLENQKSVELLKKELLTLKKSLDNYKELNKEILNIEEKLIEEIAINLMKSKKKI